MLLRYRCDTGSHSVLRHRSVSPSAGVFRISVRRHLANNISQTRLITRSRVRGARESRSRFFAPLFLRQLSTDTSASQTETQKPEVSNDAQKVVFGKIIEPYKTLLFTCKVCNTRSARTFSSKAYYEGVVVVKCDGCDNNHLIADNLGWFRDKKMNAADLAREQGETLQELKVEDLMDVPADAREKMLEAARMRSEYLAQKKMNHGPSGALLDKEPALIDVSVPESAATGKSS